jgi:multidrug resistance protein, MATE family
LRNHPFVREFTTNFKLAYPIILGMLGHTIVGIIDNIMVGKLGPTELAAASLANSIVFVAMSLGIGFSTAITPMAAAADGKSDISEGLLIFNHGRFLCGILGVIMFGIVFTFTPFIDLMRQPELVVALAKPYMGLIAFSLIPLIFFQSYKQFADGMSHTKFAMRATIFCNLIHIALNYLFIYGFWIFPEMGILGAGVGTVISRVLMVVYIHYAMKNHNKFKSYFEGFTYSAIQININRHIIQLGFPSAMQMFFEVALFTGAVWLSGILGVINQAANQIALSVSSFTFMFALGFGVAATIRVGNQKGANDGVRLREVAYSILILVIIMQCFFGLCFVLFHNFLPQLFLDVNDVVNFEKNTEVVFIASRLLLVAALFQISDGIQVVMLGALRGLQDVKIPMYITLFAYWVVGFPVSYYLGIHTPLNAMGIWLGLLIGLSIAAIFLYIRFNQLTKYKNNI